LSPGVRQPSFDPFGICRTYREAVTDHSPGLQPWVNRTKPHALKVASEVVSLALVLSLDDAPCWRDWWNQHIKALNTPLGRHFQGASSNPRNPGRPGLISLPPSGELLTHETTSDR
jgi:hypothetical protein